MCDGKTYMLTAKGAARMSANWEWETKEVKARGLRDPWPHRPDRLLDTEAILMKLSDQEIPAERLIYRKPQDDEMEAWRAERDEYMRQRDEFIALKMFEDFGYDTFLDECEFHHLSEDFKNSITPCESQSDAQCNLFCPQWDKCERRKNQ